MKQENKEKIAQAEEILERLRSREAETFFLSTKNGK